MTEIMFFTRKQAAQYTKGKFGIGTERTFAKLATVGGGPPFRKAGGRALYEPKHLDEWAMSRIGPLQRMATPLKRRETA